MDGQGSKGRLRTPEAALARLGMPPDDAVPILRRLRLWEARGPAEDSWAVLEALASVPNPRTALPVLDKLAFERPDAWQALLRRDGGEPDGELVRRAATLAGASPALGELIARSPQALDELTGALDVWDVDTVRQRCSLELQERPDDPGRALAGTQRRGLLRIAARDLLGRADTPQIAVELSDLAQGVLCEALDLAIREVNPDARIAIIAMGKLGGRELNYVSDIDVMFVHAGDFVDAARAVSWFLRVLGEVTPEGLTYEVDPNLRPEGKDGPLVRTLASYEAYYQRWAKTWEFQALLKARPIAGDAELGAEFIQLVQPYVWPDRLDAESVEEIQRMKGVVESSRQVRRAGTRQVKLGPGGLRDIEFAVQLLQLVHGRHDPSLRSPSTLEALPALAEGGYIDDGDANLFADAYTFLRTLEHRLQLTRLRRTHTVPASDDARDRLARAMGFRDLRAASALEQFDTELRRVQAVVRRLHEKLFYRPLLSRFAEVGATDQVAISGDGQLSEEAARERLVALGFGDSDSALAHLDALASGVTRKARLFRTLLPALLPTLAKTPDPDGGLAGLRSLADRLGASPFLLHTLRDNPPVGDLLVQVLGRSRRVGEWLERQPEVLGQLVDMDGLAVAMGADDYARLADGLIRRGGADAADGLRRIRRREAARTAVRDLAGMATVQEVAAELTGLAQACLQAAVALAVPDGLRMAVIAMGKLGAGELGYSSDLDVLFVYEPGPAAHGPAAAAEAGRAAEHLLELLSGVTPEGQVFRVDPNLRPEGKDGPLARSLDSYRMYYDRWAEPWEIQALTQARPVAGDAEVSAAFLELIEPLVYPAAPPAERLHAVRRMKARVERERALGARRAPSPIRRPGAGGRVRPGAGGTDRMDVKLGSGGMADVEWTVQLLQLRFGGTVPQLRRPGTVAALEALAAEGLLDERESQWLRDGWLLLAHLRNMLYLGGARDSDRVPAGRERERVARIMGYAGGQSLMEELGRATRRIRKIHERRFYED
ncbi:MAG TPA: bifunctional [glutamine synthetase] adenylyltransferase/[glutamine synthetase]-adenylyl-L-tyrosine phosphorylase [Egibacteraceae bacterium]|nr:bifunctional [glutamine synthetase] adenylyltransferase/[glutamine synthetase]-adenylyl-L-tyrosine phosphorylase [Egibacteraceae bacterium]